MSIQEKVLSALADGKFHSGEQLATEIGVTRAAIWKSVKQLELEGAKIDAVRGKGYRIFAGLDLLDKQILSDGLSELVSSNNIHLFRSIASTNQFLLNLDSDGVTHICLSEYQSSGRGRLGRNWHSPFAQNIYLSIKKIISLPIESLSGLSLAVGVGVAQALKKLGVAEVKLKWPNDLRVEQKKAGGILVEIARSQPIGTELVIGIGLNWDMPENQQIDQAWVNLKSFANKGISRNTVVISVIQNVLYAVEEFAVNGFNELRAVWQQFDEFVGQDVKLLMGSKVVQGHYMNVDASGAVELKIDGELKRFVGGEISLRGVE